MSEHPIRVLVVEDSEVARGLLERILTADGEICIAGFAKSGGEAIAMLADLKPDVITMDIHMPGLDGYETTRQIMETRPVPIVIVSSSYNPEDVMQTFRALEAGAVGMAEKPGGPLAHDHAESAHRLTQLVKAMAEVRVVRRWPNARQPKP